MADFQVYNKPNFIPCQKNLEFPNLYDFITISRLIKSFMFPTYFFAELLNIIIEVIH